MTVAEMWMLRWMTGETRKERIRNEHICMNLSVVPIGDKVREIRLRWFSHLQQRPMTEPIESGMVQVEGVKRTKGKAKNDWD